MQEIDKKPLHRIWIEIKTADTWYTVIREANHLYGTNNWRGQPRVKRKLQKSWQSRTVSVWFDVPDLAFASWISVKHGVIARITANK